MPCRPQMMLPVGKSGPGMICISSDEGDFGVVDDLDEGVADLAEVVRRDVGGHADGDAVAAVDEEVGELAGQDARLAVLAVVAVDEIDGVVLEVGEHLRADAGQPGLGVAVGGGRQAGLRAEVALRVDERVAHVPALGHADERRVDRRVAVRVVALHRLADDARALARRGRRPEAEVVHGDEDAALRRLEAVAHVGQGAADDDRHGVVEVAVLHLVGDAQTWRPAVALGGSVGSAASGGGVIVASDKVSLLARRIGRGHGRLLLPATFVSAYFSRREAPALR